MQSIDLGGVWDVRLRDGSVSRASLPGTLDESHVGFPDQNTNQWHPDEALGSTDDLRGGSTILTRLTRLVTYEGPAWYERTLEIDPPRGMRALLTVERSRELTLAVNGVPVAPAVQGTVSTPSVFEITGQLRRGSNRFVLCCDNSYPNWPREDILFSSAATDETQTNWNGILGDFSIRFVKENFISAVRVYPSQASVTAVVEIDCQTPCRGTLTLQSEAFAEPARFPVDLEAGTHQLRYAHLPLRKDCRRWDTGEGTLYTLAAEADGMDVHSVCFGVRTFGAQDGRLALNDRPVFIRSEANCCVFPQTGHMPLDTDAWIRVLQTYAAYGVNCMRFHSHCPPEAAFAAADRLGMLMQPELSHWNPKTALETEASFQYYQLELRQILRAYANHPSFVMLTFGNELHTGELGHVRMDAMLSQAKALDPTRLYANGSNVHYGQKPPDRNSDFYTSANYLQHMLRATSAQMQGYLNHRYPSAQASYDAEMEALRQAYSRPVFSFEVGQYEVLPDFDEIASFTGVTRPDNLTHIRERAQAAGLLDGWKRRVEATGELSLLSYREEIEAVMRTPSLSGISLLGLQDFPGQGTALVGMLNAHLEPKPFSFADPKRFRAFFADVLPLAMLARYTYRASERLTACVRIANYGKADLHEPVRVTLAAGGTVVGETVFPEQTYAAGTVSTAGTVDFALNSVKEPEKLRLSIAAGATRNEYSAWVYPDAMLTEAGNVRIARSLDEALEYLQAGETVLLDPPADEDHLPQSIQAQFTTDFWSVGTFAGQSGFMGCLMEPGHPVFRRFPTDFHTDWQWWPMCRGRAILLPPGVRSLVTGIDCYARMRNLGMLLEANVCKGRLVLSSMGLHRIQEYPEARALLSSIVQYMASDAFRPEQTFTEDQLRALVR